MNGKFRNTKLKLILFRLLEKYARVEGILETLRAEGGTQEQIEEVVYVHFFQIKGTVNRI